MDDGACWSEINLPNRPDLGCPSFFSKIPPIGLIVTFMCLPAQLELTNIIGGTLLSLNRYDKEYLSSWCIEYYLHNSPWLDKC